MLLFEMGHVMKAAFCFLLHFNSTQSQCLYVVFRKKNPKTSQVNVHCIITTVNVSLNNVSTQFIFIRYDPQ